MLVSVSVVAASRAAVSVCAATVLEASVTVAKFLAFSASIDGVERSGRSAAVAVLLSSTCPVFGLTHSKVWPGPSSLRANANASLKFVVFLIVARV